MFYIIINPLRIAGRFFGVVFFLFTFFLYRFSDKWSQNLPLPLSDLNDQTQGENFWHVSSLRA